MPEALDQVLRRGHVYEERQEAARVEKEEARNAHGRKEVEGRYTAPSIRDWNSTG